MPLILPRDMAASLLPATCTGGISTGGGEHNDPVGFVNRIVEGRCNRKGLEAEYLIPDGLSSLKACVDLKGKTLTNSMAIGAPEDRKTAKARVNRPLRQLAKAREDGIHIRATAGDLSGLAPALVLTAQCDVLHGEGERYTRNGGGRGCRIPGLRGHDPRILHDGVDDRRRGAGAGAGVWRAEAGVRASLLNPNLVWPYHFSYGHHYCQIDLLSRRRNRSAVGRTREALEHVQVRSAPARHSIGGEAGALRPQRSTRCARPVAGPACAGSRIGTSLGGRGEAGTPGGSRTQRPVDAGMIHLDTSFPDRRAGLGFAGGCAASGVDRGE